MIYFEANKQSFVAAREQLSTMSGANNTSFFLPPASFHQI